MSRAPLALVFLAAIAACVGENAKAADPGPGTCSAAEKLCGDTCVPTDDPRFGCGPASCVPCPTPANAASACTADQCASTCNTGFRDCDGDAANGCEVNTDTDVGDCGTCGNSCGASNTTNRVCDRGACVFDCLPGFIHCGADAEGCDKDARTDALNCGQCGRDCLGAACTTSLCGVLEVADGRTNPMGMALQGTDVYFAEGVAGGSGVIARVPKNGSSVPSIIVANETNTGTDNPRAVAHDGANLFFSNYDQFNPRTVRRTDAGGGTGADVGPSAATFIGGIAVAATKVFWTDEVGDVRVRRANLDGTGLEPFATGSQPTTRSVGLAVDASDVYWADYARGKIFKRAISASGACDSDPGSTNECVAIASVPTVVWIALDAGNVYFSDNAGDIGRVAKTGGPVTTLVTGQTLARGLATDGVHVYWCSAGTIRHIRADALTPCSGVACEFVADATPPSVPSLNQILVDDQAVYWTISATAAPNSGRIERVGKYR